MQHNTQLATPAWQHKQQLQHLADTLRNVYTTQLIHCTATQMILIELAFRVVCNFIFPSLLFPSFERVFELRHLIVQLLLLLAVLVIHFRFICCAARVRVTFTLLWPSPVRLPSYSCSSCCCCCRCSCSCSRVPR